MTEGIKPTIFANYSPVAVHRRRVSYPPVACVSCGEPIRAGADYVMVTFPMPKPATTAKHLACYVRDEEGAPA